MGVGLGAGEEVELERVELKVDGVVGVVVVVVLIEGEA